MNASLAASVPSSLPVLSVVLQGAAVDSLLAGVVA
jgi:hypothetical protein